MNALLCGALIISGFRPQIQSIPKPHSIVPDKCSLAAASINYDQSRVKALFESGLNDSDELSAVMKILMRHSFEAGYIAGCINGEIRK